MSHGCIVKYSTKNPMGGQSVVVLYAVAIGDGNEAIDAVRGVTTVSENEIIEYVGPLSEATIAALKLLRGQALML
jgi:hypothetical protein